MTLYLLYSYFSTTLTLHCTAVQFFALLCFFWVDDIDSCLKLKGEIGNRAQPKCRISNKWYRSQLQIISEILETVTYDGNARRNSHRPVLITRSEDSILKTLS